MFWKSKKFKQIRIRDPYLRKETERFISFLKQIKSNGSEPIYSINHKKATPAFSYSSISSSGKIRGITKDDFVIYTIGKWNSKSGFKEALISYLGGFNSDDSTVLIIAIDEAVSGFKKKAIENEINNMPIHYNLEGKPARIVLLSGILTEEKLKVLHEVGDCYLEIGKTVEPSRYLEEANEKSKLILSCAKNTNIHSEYMVNFELDEDKIMTVPNVTQISQYMQHAFGREELKKHIKVIDVGNKEGVNIMGTFNTAHGVGETARIMSKSLKQAKFPVKDSSIENFVLRGRKEDYDYANAIDYTNPYYFNLLTLNADMTPLLLKNMTKKYYENSYVIGFWAWELDEIPEQWIESYEYVDEIWTHSEFCAQTLGKYTDKPIFKVPMPIDIDNKITYSRSHFGIRDNSFVFLYMFDFASFFERKNPLALMESFLKSFPDEEKHNVQLIIKTSGSDLDFENKEKLYELAKLSSNIIIIDSRITKEERDSLMGLIDCYVSPHRSEGFGLTMMEAMSMGKPVVATAYSGNMEFMNKENSYLIDYKLIELENDIGPYKKGNHWANIDVNMLSNTLLNIYNNQEEAIKKGEMAKSHIEKEFNFKLAGEAMKKRLQLIYNNKNN